MGEVWLQGRFDVRSRSHYKICFRFSFFCGGCQPEVATLDLDILNSKLICQFTYIISTKTIRPQN